VDFRIGFRGGLKPYAQVRYRKQWQLASADLFDFRETIFWSVDDHVGSTTATSYEHAFSSTLAGRWLTSATITQRVRKFEWSSSVGAYKLLGQQRVLSLEALIGGLQGSGVTVADYGLQTRWEQPVYQDWLLAARRRGQPAPTRLGAGRRVEDEVLNPAGGVAASARTFAACPAVCARAPMPRRLWCKLGGRDRQAA
jgi:hypothetical protein